MTLKWPCVSSPVSWESVIKEIVNFFVGMKWYPSCWKWKCSPWSYSSNCGMRKFSSTSRYTKLSLVFSMKKIGPCTLNLLRALLACYKHTTKIHLDFYYPRFCSCGHSLSLMWNVNSWLKIMLSRNVLLFHIVSNISSQTCWWATLSISVIWCTVVSL